MKLDFVGLLGKEDLLPAELSGGMLKRAAVCPMRLHWTRN